MTSQVRLQTVSGESGWYHRADRVAERLALRRSARDVRADREAGSAANTIALQFNMLAAGALPGAKAKQVVALS